jgi:vesicular inhibitory amino acid transporter
LALAGSGYSAVGCQISGNLLFTIYPDATTGLTKLGFASDKGMVVLAYLFMQLHITIAFAILLHPAFYILERLVLGMHKRKPEDLEANNYEAIQTPGGDELKGRTSKGSVVSIADIEKESLDEGEEAAEYRGAVVVKYIVLRIACVVFLVVLSVTLKDHFLDLTDFVGASAITLSCIILPIVFYLKKLWTKVPVYEKVAGILVVLICLVLGCYVTYITGKNLFAPGAADPNAPNFPFCHAENHFDVYYNKTSSITA